MIDGIMPKNCLERYLRPVGHCDKMPIEIAVHALLVRELYRDGKKVFSQQKQEDTKTSVYDYTFFLSRQTTDLLNLNWEMTVMKIVANDLWSVFQTHKTVVITDWWVKIDGENIHYGIEYVNEDEDE